MILGAGLHLADVSNPAKPIEIAVRSTELVMQEFFAQGDLEKHLGIPISLLCDRENSNILESQVGFIKYVVLPLFELWAELMPEFKETLTYLNQNLEFWETRDSSNDTSVDE